MSVSKINEHSYLTAKEIEIFIKANILHAIDKELLSLKWDENVISVVEEKDKRRFVVSVTTKFEKEDWDAGKNPEEKAGCMFPTVAASFEDHLRMMMGATMKVLDDLKTREDKKPVLHLVKGGK